LGGRRDGNGLETGRPDDSEKEPKVIKRIFLDIDGVLNIGAPHFMRATGCRITNEGEYPKEAGFDMVKAWNIIMSKHGFRITHSNFWAAIHREVWATCPLSQHCDQLLSVASNRVGAENVYILTSPARSSESLAGKMDWIRHYLPRLWHRKYIMTPQKHLLANSESLLVDDSDANIEKFVKAGGVGITFPRPWNHRRGYNRSSIVESIYAA
jgi:5'(3')-deoxyribonucleotidase